MDEKRPALNWDLLEAYSYMLRRAVRNKEPRTAWDAATSLYSLFEQSMSEQDIREQEDERSVSRGL